MPIPSLDKTWHVSVNNSCPSPSSLNALVHFLTAMTSLGPSPWTVVRGYKYAALNPPTFPSPAYPRFEEFTGTMGWTNGTGVNQTVRWGNADASSTVARTWILLAQAGLGGMQLLLDCNGGGGGSEAYQAGNLYCSPSGAFTGGSTGILDDADPMTLPTAPDQFQVDTGSWVGGLGVSGKSHVMQSSDGQCTYCFHVHSNNLVATMWIFAKLKNPNPAFVGHVGSDIVTGVVAVANTVSTIANYTGLFDGNPLAVLWNGTRGNAYMATEGYNLNALGQNQTVVDSFNSSWPLTAITVMSKTPKTRGRYGQLFDMYFGSTAIVGGDDYDESGNKVFGCIGDLAVVAGGNILQVT